MPEREMLILNMPQSGLTKKVEAGESLSKQEINERKNESTNDIFVYAGFVEPGKHQIIIKD